MLRNIYEAINNSLINEHHLSKQRKFVKELFKLRKKYCVELGRNKIEYKDMLDILQTYEKEYWQENKDTLQNALLDNSIINEVKIKETILESLRLDLENPKLPIKNKVSLIKNISETIENFMESDNDKFNPFAEFKVTTCPITWLQPYTRAGIGDVVVFAAPEKTGKSTIVLSNAVDDALNGKKVLYLDYANGWNETIIRIASKMLEKNLGKMSIQELNTVLNSFQKSKVYRSIFANLTYVPHPNKQQTIKAIQERQYDYVVFDDLHKVLFDKNISESTLKAYNWALTLAQENNQCALILGHPNDNNTTMETFVLSGGQRLHKDLTSLIAMLPAEEGKNVLHIKAIRERKFVADLDMYIELQPPTGYKVVNYSTEQIADNTALEKLESEDNFSSLGLDSLY